jgi:peptide/nickel transport system substrate-binding protein
MNSGLNRAADKAERKRRRMAYGVTRRAFAAASAAGLASFGFSRKARAADSKTLRFIPRTDLRVIDPIWTTAYAARNHGYMIFDTLFALDSKFKPQPQMVGDYSISPDKLTYRFGLRPGLKFHDGEPVRGADCTASLQRWMAATRSARRLPHRSTRWSAATTSVSRSG